MKKNKSAQLPLLGVVNKKLSSATTQVNSMVKSIKSTPFAGWNTIGAGYESTQSTRLIGKIIDRIKNNRLPIFLINKSYQSGYTLIIDCHDHGLLIDPPPDWPGKTNRIRILFRDQTNLTTFFDVKVTSVHEQGITTSMPKEIFRLQRRNDYRVDVPIGSHVSFKINGTIHTGLTIKNISAGGMLFYTKAPIDPEQNLLSDIALAIPSLEPEAQKEGGKLCNIRQGKIVRNFYDRRLAVTGVGVSFSSDPQEEDELAKYIRLRERELLSKGFLS
ncbi:MAG: PilZ domain-containing protein [Desulfobulbaceae bacterium]|nr:PilZ domain-containing protein [Desulfobulbaceae bacterium]HIJ79323.1 hypothetical protein [Deltaproteobacteria bacterium]